MSRIAKLERYREVAPLSEIPEKHLRLVLVALLDYLNVEIVREATPDYTSYEVQRR